MRLKLTFLLTFSLLVYATTAFNVTQLLGNYSDFSTFNNYLTQTQLATEINSLQSITLLVVENNALSGSLSGKSMDMIRKILSVHIMLNYYDVQRFQDIPSKTKVITTYFQTSGVAKGLQGFLNVSNSGERGVVIESADTGSTSDATLVKSVVEEPYNISVLQISSAIVPDGIDGDSPYPAPSNSPSPRTTPNNQWPPGAAPGVTPTKPPGAAPGGSPKSPWTPGPAPMNPSPRGAAPNNAPSPGTSPKNSMPPGTSPNSPWSPSTAPKNGPSPNTVPMNPRSPGTSPRTSPGASPKHSNSPAATPGHRGPKAHTPSNSPGASPHSHGPSAHTPSDAPGSSPKSNGPSTDAPSNVPGPSPMSNGPSADAPDADSSDNKKSSASMTLRLNFSIVFMVVSWTFFQTSAM